MLSHAHPVHKVYKVSCAEDHNVKANASLKAITKQLAQLQVSWPSHKFMSRGSDQRTAGAPQYQKTQDWQR